MSKTRIKRSKTVNIVSLIILSITAVVAFYPFYNVIIISLAKYEVITKEPIYLIPKSFDISAYTYIFKEKEFLNAFLISVLVTVTGTFLNMVLSTAGAYALAKKNMPGRNMILWAIIFTMYFNGGMIPYYLVSKELGMVNNILCMILPVAINTYYMIIMKNYFLTISPSIEESAKLDGANDIYILIKIILPISAPFIATFTLFYAVDRWNEWYNALLFLTDSRLHPLQIVMRNILISFSNAIGDMAKNMMEQTRGTYLQSVQMACIVVTAIPIISFYPFLQKYFVKGIMIGSVKS